MKDYLLQVLSFQNTFGVNESFDFTTGRDFFYQENGHYTDNKANKNDGIQIESNNVQNKKNENDNLQDENIIGQQNELVSKENKPESELEFKTNESDLELNEKIQKLNEKTQIDLSKNKTFDELITSIQNFNGCDLKLYSNNTVIYDGNKKAKIMLIGEAPGETEDKEGRPFCGQSGLLLRKALNCINLNTSNLLITNTVYWRPPENRKPTEQELEICRPFMIKMIEIVEPKLIILCGATAINSILNVRQKMSQITGKVNFVNINSRQIKVFQIYHPSFLLRQPSMKKIFWEHLLKLDDEIKKL